MSELEQFCQGLQEFFGSNLAHYEREPRRFAWQCKIFKYMWKHIKK